MVRRITVETEIVRPRLTSGRTRPLPVRAIRSWWSASHRLTLLQHAGQHVAELHQLFTLAFGEVLVTFTGLLRECPNKLLHLWLGLFFLLLLFLGRGLGFLLDLTDSTLALPIAIVLVMLQPTSSSDHLIQIVQVGVDGKVPQFIRQSLSKGLLLCLLLVR